MHSRDATVLIDLLWFNVVQYSNLFQYFFRSTMAPTLVENSCALVKIKSPNFSTIWHLYYCCYSNYFLLISLISALYTIFHNLLPQNANLKSVEWSPQPNSPNLVSSYWLKASPCYFCKWTFYGNTFRKQWKKHVYSLCNFVFCCLRFLSLNWVSKLYIPWGMQSIKYFDNQNLISKN